MLSFARYFRVKKDRLKFWNAVLDYPVYLPPHVNRSGSIDSARKNYEFFLENKAHRIEYLSLFLKKFSVECDFSAKTINDISLWLYRYGGYVVEYDGVTAAMQSYCLVWKDSFLGINVIYDIGIFIGEYVVTNNPKATWGLFSGYGRKNDLELIGFQHPCIYGVDYPPFERQVMYTMGIISEGCFASRSRTNGRAPGSIPWDNPDELSLLVKNCSDPDPVKPVPYSFKSLDG